MALEYSTDAPNEAMMPARPLSRWTQRGKGSNSSEVLVCRGDFPTSVHRKLSVLHRIIHKE